MIANRMGTAYVSASERVLFCMCSIVLLIATLFHFFNDILNRRRSVRALEGCAKSCDLQSPHCFLHAHLLNFIQDQAALFASGTMWNAEDFCKSCDCIPQFELLFRHRERLCRVIPSRYRSRGALLKRSYAANPASCRQHLCWPRNIERQQAVRSGSHCRERGSLSP